MKLNMGKPIAAGLILALIGISGCADNPITPAGENAESGRSESGAEHGDNADSESHESSEGGAGRLAAANEEGGQQLTLDQRYDQTRNGARLIMWYSPSKNAFYGIVENTTNPNFAPGAGGSASVRRVRRDHRGVGAHLAEESHTK